MITVIGLGPGSIEDMSLRAWAKLRDVESLYVRTRRHPCVHHLPSHLDIVSFDDVYEAFDEFDDVYREICDRLVKQARSGIDLVYAVPGDPLVGEATVTRLAQRASSEGLELEIVNGISFIEPCLALLGIDALDGIQILDALEIAAQYHPPMNPAKPALLAQVYSQAVASNLKLALMNQYPDRFAVKLIHGAGRDEAIVEEICLYEIDRSDKIDVMTSLYVPALGALSSFESFQDIIAHLRSPDGCPWDREQSHQSLRPFLIEETYEVLDALDAEDPKALCEELGDLLLQIVLHTQIAIDNGEFFMSDVLQHVNKKMIRRHPHVWGDADVQGDPRQVTSNWEDIKRTEQVSAGAGERSLLDGVPKGAPALLVAHQYSKRAAKVGFDWPDASGVEEKAREEINEIFTAATTAEKTQEIGDLIFVLVNWLRWLGVDDPESLLREINAKFYRRFAYVEARARQNRGALLDYSLEELDAFWQAAKRAGL
ncbi:MAG: nucleoside triphosphate pyrophosphohydrolase [Chloroflexi bacterium]|nr:nucleoside triphosphate pyrophosphohydrolase [Chloroflexota bacterium]